MIRVARPRALRRPGLAAMIDVVFLLIVFFMVASRLDHPQGLRLTAAGAGAGAWQGPPRLVELGPDGLTLNGTPVQADRLAAALRPLMPAGDAPVLLALRDGVTLARLAPLIARLQDDHLQRLILIAVP